MSSQVVIPFPQMRRGRAEAVESEAPELRRRERIRARLTTAKHLVIGLVETLSYLGDARVRPLAPSGDRNC